MGIGSIDQVQNLRLIGLFGQKTITMMMITMVMITMVMITMVMDLEQSFPNSPILITSSRA